MLGGGSNEKLHVVSRSKFPKTGKYFFAIAEVRRRRPSSTTTIFK